jgi:hypothetical protein
MQTDADAQALFAIDVPDCSLVRDLRLGEMRRRSTLGTIAVSTTWEGQRGTPPNPLIRLSRVLRQ